MKKEALLSCLKQRYQDIPEKELYARILCGEVQIRGETLRDPARKISPDCSIDFIRKEYVSRGGYKLETALKLWKDIPVEGSVFLDAGASTGGFTDCLLQKGARLVHAVDVGYNQLDYTLRRDSRVQVHERCNIMNIQTLTPSPDYAVADLSFRSLAGAARHILELTSRKEGYFLVKPQFEYREAPDSFDGIVEDRNETEKILAETLHRLKTEGVSCLKTAPSSVKGQKGNQEYLAHLKLAPTP